MQLASLEYEREGWRRGCELLRLRLRAALQQRPANAEEAAAQSAAALLGVAEAAEREREGGPEITPWEAVVMHLRTQIDVLACTRNEALVEASSSQTIPSSSRFIPIPSIPRHFPPIPLPSAPIASPPLLLPPSPSPLLPSYVLHRPLTSLVAFPLSLPLPTRPSPSSLLDVHAVFFLSSVPSHPIASPFSTNQRSITLFTPPSLRQPPPKPYPLLSRPLTPLPPRVVAIQSKD